MYTIILYADGFRCAMRMSKKIKTRERNAPQHPGQVLRAKLLSQKTVKQVAFAKMNSIPNSSLSQVMSGKRSVSAFLALKLAKYFKNTTPHYWLKLQNEYDLFHARKKFMKRKK